MAKRKYDPRQSSVAVGKQRKRGLLPLILVLLALLIVAGIIVGLVSCGSKNNKSTPASTAATASAPASTGTAAPSPAPTTTGSLSAGSASLLGGSASTIVDHAGEKATGVTVKVLSVIKPGFFVGTDESDRQYVEYGGKVGADETTMKLPAVGDVVALTGEVRPAPKSPATTLKLEQADAMTVSARGAYANATSVTPAG